jgi:quercetin dioxygenase-like cupin family protein
MPGGMPGGMDGIRGADFRLKEGDTIIMPANKRHALKAVTKFKMILIMVRSE